MRAVMGWLAFGTCLGISLFWSSWGAIENFHEGWYYRSLGQNLILAIFQYWLWPILFALVGSIGIAWPRIGAVAFWLIGLLLEGFLFRFRFGGGSILIFGPCLLLGLLFWFGRVNQRRVAIWALTCIPIWTIFGISVPLGWRVTHRITSISANPWLLSVGGKELIWAPPGPGWPDSGTSFDQANDICRHLSEDGRRVEKPEIKEWRLPTVEEAIVSLNRMGKPAGCTYVGPNQFSPCPVTPDKEAPLWNPYSPIIYWWTSTTDSSGKDLRVTYNGYVLPVSPKFWAGDVSFRAVRTRSR